MVVVGERTERLQVKINQAFHIQCGQVPAGEHEHHRDPLLGAPLGDTTLTLGQTGPGDGRIRVHPGVVDQKFCVRRDPREQPVDLGQIFGLVGVDQDGEFVVPDGLVTVERVDAEVKVEDPLFVVEQLVCATTTVGVCVQDGDVSRNSSGGPPCGNGQTVDRAVTTPIRIAGMVQPRGKTSARAAGCHCYLRCGQNAGG